MHKWPIAFIAGFGCALLLNIAQSQNVSTSAFFCPEDGCDNIIISNIRSAQRTIHIAIYSFTLDAISDELIKAAQRGVEIKVVLERSQLSNYSEYEKLKAAGIDVRLDTNPAAMHNKFAIIDGVRVITGSYNWSRQATTQNDENIVIIDSPTIAKAYENEFYEIWAVAE